GGERYSQTSLRSLRIGFPIAAPCKQEVTSAPLAAQWGIACRRNGFSYRKESESMITRLLRRSWVSVLFGVALIALTVAPTGAQEALPRNETLYVAGMQWSTFITFNPLADPGTFPAIGENTYTYETLFAFNVATGNIDPLLAKEVTFPDATTAVVTLQD